MAKIEIKRAENIGSLLFPPLSSYSFPSLSLSLSIPCLLLFLCVQYRDLPPLPLSLSLQPCSLTLSSSLHITPSLSRYDKTTFYSYLYLFPWLIYYINLLEIILSLSPPFLLLLRPFFCSITFPYPPLPHLSIILS